MLHKWFYDSFPTSKSITPEFLERCKKARKEAGLSIENVANDLGVTKGLISKFENGKNTNGYITFYYILELGVEI